MADSNDLTKQLIRSRVWDEMSKQDLMFAGRFGRIPNFKGAEQAAAQLATLDDFIQAKTVHINLDKALEYARLQVLEHGKDMLVPMQRLKNSLLKKMTRDDSEKSTMKTVRRWNIKRSGQNVPINESVRIDLIILGSMAVSRQGHRIGRGKGFDDLDYAILCELGFVTADTKIITLVHDAQVFGTFSADLFGKHDVPVDWIITPTAVIKAEKGLQRPEKIFWDLLTKRRVEAVKILQQIRAKHEEKGLDTTLMKFTGDEEKPKRARKALQKRSESTSNEENGTRKRPEKTSYDENGTKKNRRRFFRKKVQKDEGTETNNESDPSEKSPRKQRYLKRVHQKLNIDFSLLVSNIGGNVRVRDIKNALTKQGIKPDDITWKGHKGFCYLHYSKPFNKNNKENAVDEPFSVDSVIECLQALKFDDDTDNKNKLCINVMEPITRIETTDVTSV